MRSLPTCFTSDSCNRALQDRCEAICAQFFRRQVEHITEFSQSRYPILLAERERERERASERARESEKERARAHTHTHTHRESELARKREILVALGSSRTTAIRHVCRDVIESNTFLARCRCSKCMKKEATVSSERDILRDCMSKDTYSATYSSTVYLLPKKH